MKDRKGYALALVLMLLLAATFFATALMSASGGAHRKSVDNLYRTQARHQAESALRLEMWLRWAKRTGDTSGAFGLRTLTPNVELPEVWEDTVSFWPILSATGVSRNKAVTVSMVPARRIDSALFAPGLRLMQVDSTRAVGGPRVYGNTTQPTLNADTLAVRLRDGWTNLLNNRSAWVQQVQRNAFDKEALGKRDSLAEEDIPFQGRQHLTDYDAELLTGRSRISVEAGDLSLESRNGEWNIRNLHRILVRGTCELRGDLVVEDMLLACEGDVTIKGAVRGRGLEIHTPGNLLIAGPCSLQVTAIVGGAIDVEDGAYLSSTSILATRGLRGPIPGKAPVLRVLGRSRVNGHLVDLGGSRASPEDPREPPGIQVAGQSIVAGTVFAGQSSWIDGEIHGSMVSAQRPQGFGRITRDSLPSNVYQPANLLANDTTALVPAEWRVLP